MPVTSKYASISALFLLALTTLLAGCGSSNSSNKAALQLLQGVVLGAGEPVVAATVTVYSSSQGSGLSRGSKT